MHGPPEAAARAPALRHRGQPLGESLACRPSPGGACARGARPPGAATAPSRPAPPRTSPRRAAARVASAPRGTTTTGTGEWRTILVDARAEEDPGDRADRARADHEHVAVAPTRRPRAPPPSSRRGRRPSRPAAPAAARAAGGLLSPTRDDASRRRPRVRRRLVYGGRGRTANDATPQRRADARGDAAPRRPRAPRRPPSRRTRPSPPRHAGAGRQRNPRGASATGIGELCSSRTLDAAERDLAERAGRGRPEHDQRRRRAARRPRAGRPASSARGGRRTSPRRRRAAARAPGPARPRAVCSRYAWYSASTRAGPGGHGAGTTAQTTTSSSGRAGEHAPPDAARPRPRPSGGEADHEVIARLLRASVAARECLMP